jgi:hypothetical protein
VGQNGILTPRLTNPIPLFPPFRFVFLSKNIYKKTSHRTCHVFETNIFKNQSDKDHLFSKPHSLFLCLSGCKFVVPYLLKSDGVCGDFFLLGEWEIGDPLLYVTK